ncbi:hypothetical protein GW17_00058581 [Ensete ventricosum]|nr:hypothetical protein GW17_00058581 [Ensete ventricosum]
MHKRQCYTPLSVDIALGRLPLRVRGIASRGRLARRQLTRGRCACRRHPCGRSYILENPDPDEEDEGCQMSSSLAISTRWIVVAMLL